ncbi:MAG: acylphosphatase [Alphaproteobacteria bacterium]|nr:MAG: acylphosphatase [Alphaproteobacteria bacterium]
MTQSEATKAVHLTIRGRVQGVFYRSWTREQAARLGLRGWVRNRRDGTVEAVIAGPADAVERMITLCHEGPPHAHVEAVEVAPAFVPDSPTFDVRPTA